MYPAESTGAMMPRLTTEIAKKTKVLTRIGAKKAVSTCQERSKCSLKFIIDSPSGQAGCFGKQRTSFEHCRMLPQALTSDFFKQDG
jgi:hypothetical protein